MLHFFIIFLVTFFHVQASENVYLLPEGLEPKHYNIKLTTKIDQFNVSDISTFNFDGIVEIILSATLPEITSIVLNAKRVKIKDSTLKLISTGEEIGLVNSQPVTDGYQKITYDLIEGSLDMNENYSLTINYKGRNSKAVQGLYRGSYEDVNGKRRWLLATQFEPVDARRAFPCFDEPKYKATYTISVSLAKSLKGYNALSNTPQSERPITDPDNINNKLITFQTIDVPISSYIIAVVVSDFPSTNVSYFNSDLKGHKTRKEFRTWGNPKFINRNYGELSQVIGPDCLEYLTKKLKIGYPLLKMDQVGTEVFDMGGMENWGLILYQDDSLFLNLEDASIDKITLIASIIAHETSHQWFGNLVTLHWWSDVWLNEGFANYFQYFATAELHNNTYNVSKWQLDHLYLANEFLEGALILDAIRPGRPMTAEVYSPKDIPNHFDYVSYGKSGSVLKMFSHILGEDIFYKGLQIYLQARKFKIATPKHLTDNLQKSVDQAAVKPNLNGKTVEEILTSWRTQAGFPVVTVKRKTNDELVLSQKRFSRTSGNKLNEQWIIPITYTTNKDVTCNTSQTLWMTPHQQLTINIDPDVEWFFFNNQATGYYRVNYDIENWKVLIKILKNELTFMKIHTFNRAQLISDSFHLASSEHHHLPSWVPHDLISYIKHETELAPILVATAHIQTLRFKLAHYPSASEQFRTYSRKVVLKRYKALQLKPERFELPSRRLQKDPILSLACELGIKDCIRKSNKMFRNALLRKKDKRFKINPDMRRVVYCSAIRNGGHGKWNMLWKRYLHPKVSFEKKEIVSALGCSRHKDILERFLLKTLQEKDGVKEYDRFAAFEAVYRGNPENVRVASNFLEKNFVQIVKKFRLRDVKKILSDLSMILSTKQDLRKMKNIQRKLRIIKIGGSRILYEAVSAAVDVIRGNIQWAHNKLPHLEKWLRLHS